MSALKKMREKISRLNKILFVFIVLIANAKTDATADKDWSLGFKWKNWSAGTAITFSNLGQGTYWIEWKDQWFTEPHRRDLPTSLSFMAFGEDKTKHTVVLRPAQAIGLTLEKELRHNVFKALEIVIQKHNLDDIYMVTGVPEYTVYGHHSGFIYAAGIIPYTKPFSFLKVGIGYLLMSYDFKLWTTIEGYGFEILDRKDYAESGTVSFPVLAIEFVVKDVPWKDWAITLGGWQNGLILGDFRYFVAPNGIYANSISMLGIHKSF